MIRAAALLTLLAGPAAAQPVAATPEEVCGAESVAAFRKCRAAAFHHLDGDPDPEATAPRSLAEAILWQVAFVMSESLNRTPFAPLEGARRRVEVAEGFLPGFSRGIAENRERFNDRGRRERALLDCVAVVRGAAAGEIDGPARVPPQGAGAPRAPDAER